MEMPDIGPKISYFMPNIFRDNNRMTSYEISHSHPTKRPSIPEQTDFDSIFEVNVGFKEEQT